MRNARERGAVMVEFALIVPLLLLLVLGLIEFGYRYQKAAVFSNAAFIAARDMTINCDASVAKNAAVAAGAPSIGSVTVASSSGCSSPGVCQSGAQVTVTINWPMASPTKILGNNFTGKGTGVAKCGG